MNSVDIYKLVSWVRSRQGWQGSNHQALYTSNPHYPHPSKTIDWNLIKQANARINIKIIGHKVIRILHYFINLVLFKIECVFFILSRFFGFNWLLIYLPFLLSQLASLRTILRLSRNRWGRRLWGMRRTRRWSRAWTGWMRRGTGWRWDRRALRRGPKLWKEVLN